MTRYIIQNRRWYYPDTTISSLHVNFSKTGYALEDTVRARGIKVQNYTAIPENVPGYNIAIKYSEHFKKDVVVLYTDIIDGTYTIIKNGVKFTNVYSHGGNDNKDTDGCVLVAKNKGIVEGIPKIWDSISDYVFTYVKSEIDKGNKVKWIIKNYPNEAN